MSGGATALLAPVPVPVPKLAHATGPDHHSAAHSWHHRHQQQHQQQVVFREEQTIGPRLQCAWASQLVVPLICVYVLCLFCLWLIDGADSAQSLRLGWWFAWQLLALLVLLPPYVETYRGAFDGVDDGSHEMIVERSVAWIQTRVYVQFIATLAAATVSGVFFVARVIDLAYHCDVGTYCNRETTTFAMATAISLIQCMLCLFLSFLVSRCFSLAKLAAIPAPPPASKRHRDLRL